MNNLAIVQARLNSNRLPGKVLLPLRAGVCSLLLIISRLKKIEFLDKVIVATSTNNSDNVIVVFCKHNDIECFRGSENDLLDRFYQAAKSYDASNIMRLTADCPLLDMDVLSKVYELFVQSGADYASNVNPPTFPDGLDVEILKFSALERAWKEASGTLAREHLTYYIRKHPEIFQIVNFKQDRNMSNICWCLDRSVDFEFIVKVLGCLPADFTMHDVLSVLERHPEFSEINKGVITNEWAKPDKDFFDGLHGEQL